MIHLIDFKDISKSLLNKKLDSGLDVLIAQRPHFSFVSVIFGVRAGSRFEPDHLNGISHMLEHMMFRGCEKYPSAFKLNLAIEDIGGSIDATTSADYTTYELNIPRENFDEGLRRFAEILKAPLFLDLEIEKRILAEELREDISEEGDEINAAQLSRRLVFKNHSLGRNVGGTIDDLSRISEQDLREYKKQFYVGKNSAIAIVGAIDIESTFALVKDTFDFMEAGERSLAIAPQKKFDEDRIVFAKDSSSQSEVVLSFQAVGVLHQDQVVIEMLGRILGEGMTSRLQQHLRDRLGLTYDCFVSLDLYEDCGVLDLCASVDHTKVPNLINQLYYIIDDISNTHVTKQELQRAQKRWIWEMRGLLDNPDLFAHWLILRSLLGQHISLEQDYTKIVSVSENDILSAAQQIFVSGSDYITCVGRISKRLQDQTKETALRWSSKKVV